MSCPHCNDRRVFGVENISGKAYLVVCRCVDTSKIDLQELVKYAQQQALLYDPQGSTGACYPSNSFNPFSQFKPRPGRELCLRCGKPKTHNNSFCSAECCKEYQREKRDSRLGQQPETCR